MRAAAKRVAESKDAKTVCTTLVTKRFIDEVYEGDREACIKTPLTKEDEKTGEAEIGRVSVDGSQADVEITQVGGDADGTKGTLMFAREGGQWRLDRFGED